MKTTVSEPEIRAKVLEALQAAGAQVVVQQAPCGDYLVVNGRRPRWEIRQQRWLGTYHVGNVNVGRGRIGRGLKIIRPKDGQFDYTAIAQLLIADAAKQTRESQAQEQWSREAQERQAKTGSNAEVILRIAADKGATQNPVEYGYQKTAHCKLVAGEDGIRIETSTKNEAETRAVVDAIEHTLGELRGQSA